VRFEVSAEIDGMWTDLGVFDTFSDAQHFLFRYLAEPRASEGSIMRAQIGEFPRRFAGFVWFFDLDKPEHAAAVKRARADIEGGVPPRLGRHLP
jgi:hypothetical protein